MPVTATTLRLATRLRTDLLKITDQQTRDLTKAWVDAWDGVAGDLDAAINDLAAHADNGTITKASILRSQRLRNALDAIGRELTRLGDLAGTRITEDLAAIVQAAGEREAAVIGSQLPAGQRDRIATVVGTDQLDAIVTRTTERITAATYPLSSDAYAVLRRELVRGLAAGRNPRVTAARVVKRAEGGFNGGLARALTIARTETLDAYRTAARAAHTANRDVLRGWVWLCALSSRTCPACLGMNGTEHELTEPGPLGHQNCRCTRVPLIKTWRDLGIDLDEPAGPAVPDSREWFAAQPTKVQQQILGTARYAAWRRGDYPITQWAARVKNTGWRDSYTTSPTPVLKRPGYTERLRA